MIWRPRRDLNPCYRRERMATKGGFSKGWKTFVDHKWSKKRFGTSFAVVSLQTHYQEFACASDCSRKFPNDFAPWRQGRSRQKPPVVERGSAWNEMYCGASLERRTHIEYNCSRNEYNDGFGGSLIRSNTRGCPCAALRPRRSVFLHTGNRARSGCQRRCSATRARKPLQSGIDSAQVRRQSGFLSG